MSVLMLNASFEPIKVISTHKAVCLVVTDKAEIVEARPGRFRSPSRSIPVPAVIRLRVYAAVPFRATVPLNRRAVLARDNHTCAYCRQTFAVSQLTIDHVHPRAKGGEHRWENVVCACKGCNGKKGDRTLAELGWRMFAKPYAPTGWRWLVLGVAEVEPAWRDWLDLAA